MTIPYWTGWTARASALVLLARDRLKTHWSSPPDHINWIIPFGMKIPDAANKNLDGDMAIRDFISIILEAGKSAQHLNPTILEKLFGKLDIHLNVNTPLTSSPIRIRRISAKKNDEKFLLYFFLFEDENFVNEHRTLAFRSPANAVLAIRKSWGRTRHNLVYNFIRYGIPFHTLQRNGETILENFTFPELHILRMSEVA